MRSYRAWYRHDDFGSETSWQYEAGDFVKAANRAIAHLREIGPGWRVSRVEEDE